MLVLLMVGLPASWVNFQNLQPGHVMNQNWILKLVALLMRNPKEYYFGLRPFLFNFCFCFLNGEH
jgi:hypothetical protein